VPFIVRVSKRFDWDSDGDSKFVNSTNLPQKIKARWLRGRVGPVGKIDDSSFIALCQYKNTW
jgi:hypothetical protein